MNNTGEGDGDTLVKFFYLINKKKCAILLILKKKKFFFLIQSIKPNDSVQYTHQRMTLFMHIQLSHNIIAILTSKSAAKIMSRNFRSIKFFILFKKPIISLEISRRFHFLKVYKKAK
jgi:hypothetical protein